MRERQEVVILYGGRSSEHEISVVSARSVFSEIDHSRFSVSTIAISDQGNWYADANGELLNSIDRITDRQCSQLQIPRQSQLTRVIGAETNGNQIVVFFPLLHGPFGEDGCIQGLCEIAGLAYVGSNLSSSAICMDKDLCKRLMQIAGVNQVPHRVVNRIDWGTPEKRNALIALTTQTLNYPLFIKPANLGSSVGIRRIQEQSKLVEAVENALQYDHKVIIEQAAIDCREIECAVLGNDEAKASIIGEIIPDREFYDYESKYSETNQTRLAIPAHLPQEIQTKIQQISLQAYKIVGAAGLARIDFFVCEKSNAIYLNEINTMPGFTKFSMYPKLWQASGLDYQNLINRLIDCALERYHADQQLLRT